MVVGRIWLYFAKDKKIDIKHALHNIVLDVQDQVDSIEGVFYWKNKITIISILLKRISTTKGSAFMKCLMEVLLCQGKIPILELIRSTILPSLYVFIKLGTKESFIPYFL